VLYFALPYGGENREAPTALVFRPSPLFNRCLGASLFAVIGMDRYCAKEHIQIGRPLPAESRGLHLVSTLKIESAGEGAEIFPEGAFQ
jgi:hypothetical protein